MFSYTICFNFSTEYFFLACKALEKRIPNIKKGRSYHDVDDSRMQDYVADGNHITVYNDYQTDVVYIESEKISNNILYNNCAIQVTFPAHFEKSPMKNTKPRS